MVKNCGSGFPSTLRTQLEIVVEPLERPVRQVGPVAPLAIEQVRAVQALAVARGVERFEAAGAPHDRLVRRALRQFPVVDLEPQRLAERVDVGRHRYFRSGLSPASAAASVSSGIDEPSDGASSPVFT